jgi:PAS domain S-box-containing protein
MLYPVAPTLYEQLFLHSPDALFVVASNGQIVLANQHVEDVLGYRPQEIVGRSVESLVPDRYRVAHERHREGFMTAGRLRPMGTNLDLHAVRKDGSEVRVEISLSPIEVDGSRVVLASMRDISATLRAHEAARHARYHAKVAEFGRFALGAVSQEQVYEALPKTIASALEVEVVMVFLLTPDNSIAKCPFAYGVSDDLYQSWNLANNASTPIGYVVSCAKPVIVDNCAKEKRFAVPENPLEVELTSMVGVPLFDQSRCIGALIACSKTPHYFNDGAANFLQATANIVSAALNRLRVESELAHVQRLESIGQLTGGIAHDFNNLLTVISGNLQILEDVVSGDSLRDALPFLTAAKRAGHRGAELTGKLLSFARRQTLAPKEIDLRDLMGQVESLLARTLGERITLSVEVSRDASKCFVDPTQLENAVLNLALNARDAMPNGGRLAIQVGDFEVGDQMVGGIEQLAVGRYVMIAVTDTGCGMPPDVLKRVFEPFYTTKADGRGTGLGLSMVYGFAKQSGGDVAIYSEVGVGTTVRMYLPCAVNASGASTADAEPSEISRGTETILVVEDSAEVRAIASAFLRSLGYRVIEAEDARAALRILARETDVALLFTDVVLGGDMNGPQLAAEARLRYSKLKVIFTSGYAKGTPQFVLESDHEILIAKTYRKDVLAAQVRRCLDSEAMAK